MRVIKKPFIATHSQMANLTTTLSKYEEQREENIARNCRVLESLGIGPICNARGGTLAPLAPCPAHAAGAASIGTDSDHEWVGSSTSSSSDDGGSSGSTSLEPNFGHDPMVVTVEPITGGLGHGGIGAAAKPAATDVPSSILTNEQYTEA